MAYDEKLALRIRALLARRKGYSERKMFGGIAFMLNGKMCCGVLDDELVARVGPVDYSAALRRAHVRPMDFTGRPMVGYVYVGPAAIRAARGLRGWVEQAIVFTRSLARRA